MQQQVSMETGFTDTLYDFSSSYRGFRAIGGAPQC